MAHLRALSGFAALGAACLLVSLAACGDARRPEAGDIVKPIGPGIEQSGDPNRIVEQTLYEYTGADYTITGKRLSFAIPERYLLPDAAPGPRERIAFAFNHKNPDERGVGAVTISVSIMSSATGGNVTRANIGQLRHAFPGVGLAGPEALEFVGSECGHDVFRLNYFFVFHYPVPTSAQEARRKDPPPTSASFVAGHPSGTGAYTTLSGCGETQLNCRIVTSYSGWPMEVWIPRELFCTQRDIIALATSLADRFLIEETDRIKPYVDTRWRPIDRKWKY